MSEYLKAISHVARTVGLQVHKIKGETSSEQPTKDPGEEPGSWVFVKVHKAKWNEPRWCGPYEVLLGLCHSVKIKKGPRGPMGSFDPLL